MSGMRFLRSAGMEGSTGNLREFDISPSNTGKIYTGDAVRLSSGFIVEASGAADNNDFTIAGIFSGCRYIDVDGSVKFSPRWDGVAGRTQIKAQVIVPDNALFLIRGTTGQTYTQADIGVRKGIVYVAGNDANGQSKITLGAAGATVATGPLMVTGRVDVGDGAAWFEVSILRNQLGYNAA